MYEIKKLLLLKDELKLKIKWAKKEVKFAKNSVERHKERAMKGQSNTLAFEMKQYPRKLNKLLLLEKELKQVKMDLKMKKLELLTNKESENTTKKEEVIIDINNRSNLNFNDKIKKIQNLLTTYNFYELDKIKILSDESKELLVKNLIENKIPYIICMFDFLGFIKHLTNILTTKIKVAKELSKFLDISDRTIIGHINVLNDGSKEKSSRYTSLIYKENVEDFYNKLQLN